MARSICTGGRFGGCGRVFASTRAFDTHRTGAFGRSRDAGRRHRMTDAEMADAGPIVHPEKTHDGAKVWTLEVSLLGGATLRGSLGRDIHENDLSLAS